MDRKVWCDPTVAAWVEQHAIAIQIDIDVSAELAGRLGVHSVPTVIVFVDGVERDRATGLRPPAELLAWLDRLALGETDLDRARAALTDPQHDIHGRMALARTLLDRGLFAEALEHYAWLWCHMQEVEPATAGVRVSFMASEIQLLCQNLPQAAERFAALRDQAGAAAEAGAHAREARFDWLVLNESLGDTERTLKWHDAVKDAPAQLAVLRQVADRLIPLLRARERWSDIGRLLLDPVEKLRRLDEIASDALERLPADKEDMREGMAATMKRYLRDHAYLFIRALLATGRPEDAEATRREALRLEDSPEMRIVLDRATGRGDA
jgi:hypothetical protein